MGRKRVTVIKETDSGRNTNFKDNFTGTGMNRSDFVRSIKKGNYPNYHVRKINGIDTPISNPDNSKNNNLG